MQNYVEDENLKAVTSWPMIKGGNASHNLLEVKEYRIVNKSDHCTDAELRDTFCKYMEKELENRSISYTRDSDGAFIPNLEDDIDALELMMETAKKAGFRLWKDVMFILNIGADSWKTERKGIYRLPKHKRKYSADELSEEWVRIAQDYPILGYVEPFATEDVKSYRMLQSLLKDTEATLNDI